MYIPTIDTIPITTATYCDSYCYDTTSAVTATASGNIAVSV